MEIKIPDQQKSVIENLLAKVKSMTPEEYKTMLSGFIKFHQYSFFNKCLIYASGASQVAGFNQWKDKKRFVKVKQEHKIGAIKILAPKMLYQIKVGNEWQRVGNVAFKKFKGEKKCYPIAFFPVTVFDISDTGGEPLPEQMTKQSNIGIELILNAAKKLGYTVEYRPLEYRLGGYIEKKNIYLNSNRPTIDHIGTLVHELAHGELGHTDTNSSHDNQLMEQQAETVTYMVCQELGIERESAFYLKSWGVSENILNDFALLGRVSKKLVDNIRTNTMKWFAEEYE